MGTDVRQQCVTVTDFKDTDPIQWKTKIMQNKAKDEIIMSNLFKLTVQLL